MSQVRGFITEACRNCRFWVQTEESLGDCHFLPQVVTKTEDDFCSGFDRSAIYSEQLREEISETL